MHQDRSQSFDAAPLIFAIESLRLVSAMPILSTKRYPGKFVQRKAAGSLASTTHFAAYRSRHASSSAESACGHGCMTNQNIASRSPSITSPFDFRSPRSTPSHASGSIHALILYLFPHAILLEMRFCRHECIDGSCSELLPVLDVGCRRGTSGAYSARYGKSSSIH